MDFFNKDVKDYFLNYSTKRLFSHYFIPKVKQYDTSMSADSFENYRLLIKNSPEILKKIAESQYELKFRGCKEDKGTGKKVSVQEYLKMNPWILKNSNFYRIKRLNKSWVTHIRERYECEEFFCRQARTINNSYFAEMFQSVFVKKDCIEKFVAYSGETDHVTEEAIYSSIPWENKELLKNLDLVILLHNHYDIYSEEEVFEKRKGPYKGFILNGAISLLDINCADKFFDEKIGKIAPVLMIAANENGLSYEYIAGTSKKRTI